MRRAAPFLLLLAVAGCTKPAPVEQQDNSLAPAPSPSAPAPPPAPAAPFKVAEKTDLLDYAFSYPMEAAIIPALAERLKRRADTAKADALATAQEDREEMKAGGFPFHTHSLEINWSVAGQTPDFLSLLDETYTFLGGAHGMTGYTPLLWDKSADKAVAFPALLMAPASFAAIIHDRFCAGLNAARAEKRGAPVAPGDDDFSRCIDPMEQTLVPVSSNGKSLDGLKIVIGPYAAGPYVEGSYEVLLPFDVAMLAAIKPGFRRYFATGTP